MEPDNRISARRKAFGLRYCIGVALSAMCAGLASVSAASVEIVHSFTGGEDGKYPETALIEVDGVLYGTTDEDAAKVECGTIYGLTLEGELTFSYQQTQGNGCQAKELALGADGNLYGVTSLFGGAGASGTAFRITTDGEFTRLHQFSATGPRSPRAGLVLGRDGSFYGVTYQGDILTSGGGTFFRLTPDGNTASIDHLYNFPVGLDGMNPAHALIEDRQEDGVFYGSTSQFGPCGGEGVEDGGACGTIFRVTSDGAFTRLHAFRNEFEIPAGPLAQGPDGLLYGTIAIGGKNNRGFIFRIATDGSDYEVVHDFSVADNLGIPAGGLAVGDDGDLYGVAQGIFRLSTSGTLTTLVTTQEMVNSFGTPGLGGAAVGSLAGSLIFGSDGHLYGTSRGGGTGPCTGPLDDTVIGCGTVFRVVLDGSSGGNNGGGNSNGGGNNGGSSGGASLGGGGSGGGGGVTAPGTLGILLGLAAFGWRRRGVRSHDHG